MYMETPHLGKLIMNVNYFTVKEECMCKIVKKVREKNFSNLVISIFFNLRKIPSLDFFFIFPAVSSVRNELICVIKI